jgi:putative MATE family efflux protein
MNRPVATARSIAVFTQGSTLRHVLVMTATGSIGLIAIFVVDLLSLLYIARLKDPALTAGIGFATQILFFTISINIGLSIAVSALVARSIGANDRPRAQRLAASGLVHTLVFASAVALVMFPFRRELLTFIGATGQPLEVADQFLAWTLPTNQLMAFGMVLSGILRAAGDARRSMYVTLFGAIVTAIADPILIIGFDLRIWGAAISTNLARLTWVAIGLWGCLHAHGLIARPERKAIMRDLGPLMKIALPAILTNIAAPVANAYSVRAMADFGQAAVAAGTIIDRVAPVAFGVLFAMSGAVGPIIGQNFGAGLFQRVRSTLTNCFGFIAVYVVSVWALLFLAQDSIVWLFSATGETERLVRFFCDWGAAAWIFLGCIFAANAAFNNLDKAMLSTVFNWGRATLGTIPFVTLGAHWYGPEGVLMGIVAGASLFGLGAIASAYGVVGAVAKRRGARPDDPVSSGRPPGDPTIST